VDADGVVATVTVGVVGAEDAVAVTVGEPVSLGIIEDVGAAPDGDWEADCSPEVQATVIRTIRTASGARR
jgi:hypothetical protein